MPRCAGEVIARATRSSADGDEVLERLDAVLLLRRLVPARPELAAAADVGQDVDAAARQPVRADRGGVARLLRDLEAAVAVEQRRAGAVGPVAGRRDEEVRDLRAVLRHRLLLDDVHAGRVEEGRHRLELLGRPARHEVERGRRQEVLVGDVELRGVRGGAGDVDGADAGQGDLLARPLVAGRREPPETGADVVERGDQHAVAGRRHGAERHPLGRLEQGGESGATLQEIVEVDGQQRALRVGRSADGPVGAQREEQPGPGRSSGIRRRAGSADAPGDRPRRGSSRPGRTPDVRVIRL